MAETSEASGQAAPADSSGTTAAAPVSGTGQSPAHNQATSRGSESGSESFFDPKSIEHSPELMSAYKQMQGKWTKSMQKFKDGQKKMEAYDSFIKSPVENMHALAKQLGYQLVQANPNSQDTADATPKTWDDVYSRAKQEVMKDLQPYLGEVQQLKQKNVEQYLDSNYSDWRQHEDGMLELLKEHPTLAHDPDKLYRLAVPEELYEARAAKLAMQKLRGTTDNGAISGTSSARSTTSSTEPPKVGSSFNDFVAYAKSKLAKEGITRGV